MRALYCACGKPTRADAYICDVCKDELWRAIGDLPAVGDELDVTLTRQTRMNDQNSTRSTAEKPLPYDTAASDLLHELHSQTRALVTRCVEQRIDTRGRPDEPGDTLPTMSRWLLWRIDGITGQPWAPETMQLAKLTQRAEYVIDRPPERSFAGPCDKCGRDLYATAGRASVTCTHCGLTYDLAVRRAWLLEVVDDRLATATEIARALTSLELPVTSERIRQWAHRERIVSNGHDRLGRALYRIGDVVDLLVDTAEKQHSKTQRPQTGQRA